MDPPPPPNGQPSALRETERLKDEDWAPYKDHVHQIYVQNGKSMDEVIKSLASKRFHVTNAQAVYQINTRWGYRRRLDRNDHNHIAQKTTQRELEGKPDTRVKLCGRVIPQGVVKRSRERQRVPVLDEQKWKILMQELQRNGQFPETPPGLQVGTPTPLTVASTPSASSGLGNAEPMMIDTPLAQEDVSSSAPFFGDADGDPSNATASRIMRVEEITEFRIRLITPELARRYKASNMIPVLTHKFSLGTLLRELRYAVLAHFGKADAAEDASASETLDLWFADLPIETANYDLSVEELGLSDLLVDGVLDIYLVERLTSATPLPSLSHGTIGKEKIFSMNPHWQPQPSQTPRGLSVFLSSLRVFAHKISSREMTTFRQEGILRVIYQATRFFPILKAIRALMSNQNLSPAQSAVIVQCFFELLKDIVSLEILNSDETRLLEGSRLLFGYIFETATLIGLDDSSDLPLLEAFKTVDLSDVTNSRPVKDPVLTDFGLVDRSSLPTLSYATVISQPSPDIARTIKLTDGKYCEFSYFDFDDVKAFLRRYPDIDIDPRIIRDPHYLSGMCEANGFVVTLPGDLAKASDPCLTFDAEGLVAVYTGRASCALPGKDFQIFRPFFGTEVAIDIAATTQLLQPILEARKNENDASVVFDAIGVTVNRKQNDPEELIMLVVDCSSSMQRSSDFHEKDDGDSAMSDDDSYVEEADFAEVFELIEGNPSEREAVDLLKSQEFFKDMVAIVRASSEPQRPRVAREIIEYTSKLAEQEVKHIMEQNQNAYKTLSSRAATSLLTRNNMRLMNAASKLKKLRLHTPALVEILLLEATRTFDTSPLGWVWRAGSQRPDGADRCPTSEMPPIPVVFTTLPDALRCPITKEIFQDPVVAADGVTYERRAIERWFEMNTQITSPSTGRDIQHTALRFDTSKAKAMDDWTKATDIIHSMFSGTDGVDVAWNETFNQLRASLCSITFRIAGMFPIPRTIPQLVRISDLYGLAYRELKGQKHNFRLVLDGRLIHTPAKPPSAPSVHSFAGASGMVPEGYLQVYHGAVIMIELVDSDKETSSETQNFHLIKVYEVRRFLFGYWIDSKTIPTVSSIFFKALRFKAETRRDLLRFEDLTLEVRITDVGDGWYTRNIYQSWDSLRLGTIIPATGNLLPLERISANNTELNSTGPAVFKLNLETKSEIRRRRKSQSSVLSRLDVCKEIFSSFVNRTLAYNYANHYGLLTFSSSVKLTQSLTYVMEDFRGKVLQMKPNGNTVLWDALDKATEELIAYGNKFPKARKRIICLSDGVDTQSKTSPTTVQQRARSNKIVIDSFCIGEVNHGDLMRVSRNTGGYKFRPRSLEEAMDLGEMEPVLSLSERFETGCPSRMSWTSRIQPDNHPRRKDHPNINDRFIRVGSISSSSPRQSDHSPLPAPAKPGIIRTTRILSEIRKVVDNPHPFYDIFVSESNMGFWKIVMQGPEESAYGGAAFVLYLAMEENYPLFPPEGRFVTGIIHPNVNKHGRVCHSIFDRNWTTDTSNVQLLNIVWGLLAVPEVSDPVSTVITLDYHWDEVAFRDRIKKHVKIHAKKTREKLVEEIEARSQ